jgi:hypothetical protein
LTALAFALWQREVKMTEHYQTSSERYPFTPGHRYVETSLIAAGMIAPTLRATQRQALGAIEAAPDGLNSWELAKTLDCRVNQIQPRTSELQRMGLIRDSGKRRPNEWGNPSIVWVAPLRPKVSQNE